MMSSKIGLKSVLLALAMIAAVPTTTRAAQAPAPITPQVIVSFIAKNKEAFVAALTLFVIDTRLRTRGRNAEWSMSQLRSDFVELLNDFNIFDSKLYRQLLFLFDKYVIGLPVKLEDSSTRTKEENGSVLVVKGKKLMQKPFGLYGLFDAYVLMQMKKFTEYVPTIGIFAVLLTNPVLSLELAATKAGTPGK